MIDLERKQFIFDKIGYTPHSPAQQAIHDSQARFRILCCGRRYGKTTFGASEMTAAICDPYDPGYYWIVGPKYSAAEIEFRIVYDNIIRKLGFGKVAGVRKAYNKEQGNMFIEFPWGTRLEAKSAQHQDTLLGEGLKGVIMAEAARHTPDTWEQYVRPALNDYKGWAIFTSTPRGYNWFQGLWLLGQLRDQNPWYESWRLPSWDNPIVHPLGRNDPDILEMEQRVSPSWFAQEIGAEFTSFSGKIYDEFSPKLHVTPIEYRPEWTNVWFLDYGFSNDFVCLDVMIDPEDNMYVWREYMDSEKATFEHAYKLLKREDDPEGYHVDWGAGDPRGPDQATTISTITDVQIYSEDIASNPHESWQMGIEAVKRQLKPQVNGVPKLFIDPSCTTLIRQMDQLRAPEVRPEKNQTEGQHKYDDHGPDALRYGVGQYFEGGAGSSLSGVYGRARMTEAATFFQNNSQIARYDRY